MAPNNRFSTSNESGSSLPLHGVYRRDDNLTISNNLPTRWSYQGCFSDSTSNRALPLDQYYDNNGMTEETCIEYCDSKGYSWAGVEYAQECYCGYTLGSSAAKQNESDCNMACTGNGVERCGGSNRLNAFTNGDAAPQTNQGPKGVTYLGCYTDNVSSRTLNTSMPNAGGSGGMTVAACTSTCTSSGFLYAGVEYGRECYCGNAIQNNAGPASSGCNMVCTVSPYRHIRDDGSAADRSTQGNKTEYCGGAARMNLYQAVATSKQTWGFESGSSGWSVSASSAGQGGLNVNFASDNTGAHTGKGYVSIGSGSQYGATGQRGVCITAYPYTDTSGTYVLSFYVGGVNMYVKDPRSNYPPPYSLTVSATIAGSTFNGAVCEGNCPITNVGGTPAYAYNSYRVSIPKGYQTLVICANYDGSRRGQDDQFVLDDVALEGPF